MKSFSLSHKLWNVFVCWKRNVSHKLYASLHLRSSIQLINWWVIIIAFSIRSWSHIFNNGAVVVLLVLVTKLGNGLQKLRRLKSDRDEIWQRCFSSECASINGVGFLIWRHTLKAAGGRIILLCSSVLPGFDHDGHKPWRPQQSRPQTTTVCRYLRLELTRKSNLNRNLEQIGGLTVINAAGSRPVF